MGSEQHFLNKLSFVILAFYLLLAGCGMISIGASNSPDWCPNPRSTAPCP